MTKVWTAAHGWVYADKKSQLQALRRRHPDLPPAPGRVRRQEFEYGRGGTPAYLAAYDVHHARVIGRCATTTGIEPFGALVEQVMTSEPYASAKRVFWVVDNSASHNGNRSIDRMREAWPRAELVHLPVHASWLNQVEIFFSIVQRKVVKPQDFYTSTSWRNDCSRSKIATTPAPNPSTGASPENPSTGSLNASPHTRQHDLRRTNGSDHY